jgi:HTH-type transcriptional regulator / antitoxin HigA
MSPAASRGLSPTSCDGRTADRPSRGAQGAIHRLPPTAQALAVIDRLVERPARSAAEEVYLGALTDLVGTYENAHVAIPPTSGVDALRYLMQENGLSQADLAPLFGAPSIVSEVLSGKRRLALAYIQKLSAHFGLPVDTFLGTSEG